MYYTCYTAARASAHTATAIAAQTEDLVWVYDMHVSYYILNHIKYCIACNISSYKLYCGEGLRPDGMCLQHITLHTP
jgi:hypothetical protein